MCPVLVSISAAQEYHSGLKSLSSSSGQMRVVHKWSCEQLNRSLDVLMRWWMNDQLVSRLIADAQWSDGLGALIEAGAADREPMDRAGTGYEEKELRESTTSTRWSEYLVEGRLVVDVLIPSPSLYLVLVDD